MTAQVLRVFDHHSNAAEVAEQEYELAKRNVRGVLRSCHAWHPEQQERFRAAIQRQEEARERYIRVLGA